MGDFEELCKRVIIINFGKLLYDGELAALVKKHAPYKYISVVFSEYVDPKKLEAFGETRKFDYPEWVLRVKKNDSNEIAGRILQMLPVEDITIEDPDIEDVIRDVFTAKK